MRTYLIETLGCKANLYDSRRLAEALEAMGLRRARTGEQADVCVVNTCTVTAGADRKSRQQAARLGREHPDARVFVTGCYASLCPEELRAVPGVQSVYGREQWSALLEEINGGPLPGGVSPEGEFGVSGFGGRTRAFMKVQEGCDAGCSYCILPRVRGAPRSRPLEDALAEAGRLVEAGFREIVLTGIHLGLYGRDLAEEAALADLVTALAGLSRLERLRLSSIEALEVSPELLQAMAAAPDVVCPHLHLPLQSGDAGVLKRMNRPYTPEEFLDVVDVVRRTLNRPAVTTDVMVGFPGETEEAFANTMALCRRVCFSRMHVFPFSARPGTPAAGMAEEVPPEVASERSQRLRELGRELAAEWAESFVGSTARVLLERHQDGWLRGYTDRYVGLGVPGEPELTGRAVRVRVVGREGTSLLGRLP
ncbi:MAG: tRNA (N(6)-L-threonylcarbamoyladenosine(37)-C(2))-methylthiotransferase MtaB [Candidatus Brocadiaceae bacterium]|jgi:threonylcarbamoyladenosine tRNA methylthiotransferase MtaB